MKFNPIYTALRFSAPSVIKYPKREVIYLTSLLLCDEHPNFDNLALVVKKNTCIHEYKQGDHLILLLSS
jgi:hypothetical protein